MFQFATYPTWISPYVIPGLPIRWYSLMYIVAFAITFLLFVHQIKHKELDYTIDDTLTLFLYTIAGLILGARLFSALVYDGSAFYWTHPWLIFWPFRNGQFIGLPGMSYHGGMLGAIVGSWLFSRRYRRSFLELADALAAGIPLGYTFGRLGNFINGELWGRVSTVSWSMVFPDAPRFSTNYAWVRGIADAVGLPYTPGALVNLPRHPSQLYEAFFEGVFLWLFLWFIIRRRKQFQGFVLSWYIIGYGLVRFLIEYLREPDSNLGFVIAGGAVTEPLALFHSVLNISLGQVLSLLMVAGGVVLFFILGKRHQNAQLKLKNVKNSKKRK
jgi:phosphatidylglycerol---prolipoprotein diacylglyceryl transferase